MSLPTDEKIENNLQRSFKLLKHYLKIIKLKSIKENEILEKIIHVIAGVISEKNLYEINNVVLKYPLTYDKKKILVNLNLSFQSRSSLFLFCF